MPLFLDDLALESESFDDFPSLDLHDSLVTVRGLRSLASRQLPGLRSLSLYMKGLGPSLVEALADAPWQPQLEWINVCGNRLGAEGMEALMALRWPRLYGLAAGFDELEDRGAVAVADAALPVLVTLNLRYNGIGPTGAKAIAATYATRLVDLGLEDNPLGPAGIDALARAPFERLGRIDVRDCGASGHPLRCPWADELRAGGGNLEEGESRLPAPTEEGPPWRVRLAVIGGGSIPPDERTLLGRRLTFGRAPDADLPLKGLNVSRYHGALEGRAGQLVLIDNGSSNGLYCNRERIGPHGREVMAGDVIGVGDCRLRLLEITAP